MTPLETALLIVGPPFLVVLGLTVIADRRWHRRRRETGRG